MPVIGPIVSDIVTIARVHLVLGYSLFFVLGHLLHQGLFAEIKTFVVVLALVVAISVTAVGTSLLSDRAGTPDGLLYAYLTPNVTVAACCVFLLVKRVVERHPRFSRNRSVSLIGNASFGIYLIHPFFQSMLRSFGFTTAVLPEVLSVPLFAAALLVPSLLVAAVLYRIPRIGRFLA